MTDKTTLTDDLRHAARVIEEEDIRSRRSRFVEALRGHADNIEKGKVLIVQPEEAS